MKNTYLWAWNSHSQGARELAELLDIPRIRHEGSKFKPSSNKIVINWGSSTNLDAYHERIQWVNHPSLISNVQNKLWFFRDQQVNSQARLVPWTVSQDVAREWNEKSSVVVRNILTGHSGNGIIVVPPNGDIPRAPLYTKYIPKDAEYRVHIVDGVVIDVQRKIRDPDREPTDWKVRSYDRGFIYVRRGIQPNTDVSVQARLAFTASTLDFGAVDIIWSEKKQQAFVLEINSAPGLVGSTVVKYAEALTNLIQKKQGVNTNVVT